MRNVVRFCVFRRPRGNDDDDVVTCSKMGSADALVAPSTSKEFRLWLWSLFEPIHYTIKETFPKQSPNFSSEWARRIIVAYKKRLDPEWMLESVIKVYSIMVTENPTPGMLSNSYIVQVCYKIADDLK